MSYLICLFAGIISAFAFVPKSWIICCFIAYFILFYELEKKINKKQYFFIGFCFGFGQGAVSMLWLINALMIDSGKFAWAIPLIPIGFGLLFGIFFALPMLAMVFVPNITGKVFMFAGALCISEWVRSWFLTGFPWNLTGSVWLVVLSILQSVSVIGIYGLTLLSVLWFSIPYLFYKKYIKTALFLCISFIVVFGLGYLRIVNTPEDYVWGVKLRLVQPNIPQTLKWNPQKAEENFMQHIRMSKSKKEEKITHILWPEAASPYLLDIDENARAMTLMALNQDQTLLTGSLRLADAKTKQVASSIFIIDDMGEIKSFADKSHLVPFGEYMPLRGWFGLEKLVPIESDFKAGEGVKTLYVPNAPKVGVLDCYEIIFPHEVVNQKMRPKWLFNATNDSWYGISDGPYQHLGAAQTRAVEEGLPVVRVATGGISAVISPIGKIIASLPLDKKGILDSQLPCDLPQTIYARLGNKMPLILAIICILFALFLKKCNYQLTKEK